MPQKFLKQEIIDAVRRDKHLRIELMQLLDKNERTIYRYLERKNSRLIEYTSLELILQYLPQYKSPDQLLINIEEE